MQTTSNDWQRPITEVDILGAWLRRRLFTIDLQHSFDPQRTLAVTTRTADDKEDHNGRYNHDSGTVLMRMAHINTAQSIFHTVGLPLSQEKWQSGCEECHASRLPMEPWRQYFTSANHIVEYHTPPS